MSVMETAEAAITRRLTIRERFTRLDRRGMFLVAFFVGALVYSQAEFWNQPSVGDRANWDYFAQVIARGGVPYRDVVNIKSPLSAYIGATAIVIARPFGMRDVLAIRITFLLLACLTLALTFLVALDYFNSPRVALFAAVIMLTFDAFARFNSGGIQPKTPMVLFGLLTLWAILKDRPFTAGVVGMLSALSWQPGLLFVGVAGLGFSRYFTSWRDMKVVRLIIGATIPLAVLLAYFWASGALESFYRWSIHFNFTVYAPRQSRKLEDFFTHLSRLMNGVYSRSREYFYVALAGLVIAICRETMGAIKKGAGYLVTSAPRHAVIIAPIIYFAFCMVNIQSGPDLIPLVPLVAIFAGVAFVFIIEQAIGLFQRFRSQKKPAHIEDWAIVAIVALILYRSVGGAFSFDRGFPTLRDQQPAVEEIVSHLEPGDSIFVYGRSEVLVLSGMTNASKYFVLDRGKDEYLDRVEPGGFKGWLERLKAQRPKIIVVDRLDQTPYLNSFMQWVTTEYAPRSNGFFYYYMRKDSTWWSATLRVVSEHRRMPTAVRRG
ncbi:MAG: DolP-mannose mannosyltransferase, partial [Blastocatellia bacterium]